MSDKSDQADGTEGAFESEEETTRSRLETIIPKLVKKAISQGVEVLSDEKTREKVVNDVVRKAIDKGGLVVDVTEDSVRRMLNELQTGRDLTDKVLSRLDDAKGEAGKAVRDEITKFLSQIEVSQEVRKVMSGMTMDVHTEIRFRFDEKPSSEEDVASDEPEEDVEMTEEDERT